MLTRILFLFFFTSVTVFLNLYLFHRKQKHFFPGEIKTLLFGNSYGTTGYGISHAKAFKNMIALAQKMIEKDVMSKMKDEL